MNRRTFLGMAAGAAGVFGQTAPVRVLASPYIGSAPLYLAEESGYFQKEGIKLEITEGEGSRSSIPMLAGGKTDVVFGVLSTQSFNAMARGARIRFVASRSKFTGVCPDQRRVYGSRQAFPNGFQDLRQMKGKRVSFDERQAVGRYAFARALKLSGLKMEDFTIVRVEDREAAALLAAGRIDVCFGAATQIANSNVADRVVPGPSFATFLPDFAHGHVLFGKRLLDEAPADGTKFLRALFRANRDYVAGKDPVWLKQFAKEQGYDEKRLQQRCRAEVDAEGSIDLKDMQEYIDWGVSEKLITAPLKAADCVDGRFLKEAKRG